MKNFIKYFIFLLTISRATLFAHNLVLAQSPKPNITNLGDHNYTLSHNTELKTSTPIKTNRVINSNSDSVGFILDGVSSIEDVTDLKFVKQNRMQPLRQMLNAKKLIEKQNSNTVDVSQLTTGVYIVKINQKATLQFIKK